MCCGVPLPDVAMVDLGTQADEKLQPEVAAQRHAVERELGAAPAEVDGPELAFELGKASVRPDEGDAGDQGGEAGEGQFVGAHFGVGRGAEGKIFPTINFTLAVCGVLGGLVGSATLTFALSLVCKEFGRFENWARVVMPGTVLGILLELLAKDDKFALHLGTLLPLFLVWQMTVAAIIGYCIVPRSGDGKLAPL